MCGSPTLFGAPVRHGIESTDFDLLLTIRVLSPNAVPSKSTFEPAGLGFLVRAITNLPLTLVIYGLPWGRVFVPPLDSLLLLLLWLFFSQRERRYLFSIRILTAQ